MRTLPALLLAALLLPAFPAAAQGLDQLKAQGLVGERPDGYLGATNGLPGDAARVVDDVNARRRSSYEDIARRQNTSRNAVEAVAGAKLREKTPPGQFVMDPGGGWRRK